MLPASSADFIAILFLSRQHRCGIAVTPHSRLIFAASVTLSALVRASGESAKVIMSAPASRALAAALMKNDMMPRETPYRAL